MDRKDVQVWPRRNDDGTLPKIKWSDVTKLSDRLQRGNHPFEVIYFDTLTAGQRLTLEQVMKASPTPEMPTQPEYGRSNELLLSVVRQWCSLAKETGINVVFNCHAEEVVEANGSVLIRMALTPGVVKGINQAVSAIGFLQVDLKENRKLILHQTAKILGKYRNAETGPQLPSEIALPAKSGGLQLLLDHRAKVAQNR
jgi:hypothetical protein